MITTIAVYPHLWDVVGRLRGRFRSEGLGFKGMALKTLWGRKEHPEVQELFSLIVRSKHSGTIQVVGHLFFWRTPSPARLFTRSHDVDFRVRSEGTIRDKSPKRKRHPPATLKTQVR